MWTILRNANEVLVDICPMWIPTICLQHWKYCRMNWAQYYGAGIPLAFQILLFGRTWPGMCQSDSRTHWQSAGDPSPTQKLLVICSVARAATVGVELAPWTPQDPWQALRRHISRFSISGGFSRLQSDWMNRNVSKANLEIIFFCICAPLHPFS